MSIEKFLLPKVISLIYDKECEKITNAWNSNTWSHASFGFYCEIAFCHLDGFNYKEAYINDVHANGLDLLHLYCLLKEDKIEVRVEHKSYDTIKIYTLEEDKIFDSCCKFNGFSPELQIALNDLFKGGDS